MIAGAGWVLDVDAPPPSRVCIGDLLFDNLDVVQNMFLRRELVKRPPIATRLIIEAVDDGIHAPIDQAIEIEVRAFLQSLRTEDAGEGIQAFFQKRPADFKGR